jgi:hypothetical protein
VAATERRFWRAAGQLLQRLLGVAGGLFAVGAAKAVDLGPDQAEVLYHRYQGAGLQASGPAVLVRKGFLGHTAVTGTAYVDAVSSASIDVVTSASPYSERRTEYGLQAEHVHRDARLTVSASNSSEPDYQARRLGLDVSQEVFGGMSTVSMGFTRGNDNVKKHGEPTFARTADHWQYRVGASLILTPRCLVSANAEAMADAGFLGSPYRVAQVFGATVPERVPETRSARAIKLRVVGDLGSRNALQAGVRYYWDSWGIAGTTVDAVYTQHVGQAWLLDATVRVHTQRKAVFYSDNAQADTLYVSRNRQLGSFQDTSLGARAAYTFKQVLGPNDLTVHGAFERVRYSYSDFTDLRTGQLYRYHANVMQVHVSTTF